MGSTLWLLFAAMAAAFGHGVGGRMRKKNTWKVYHAIRLFSCLVLFFAIGTANAAGRHGADSASCKEHGKHHDSCAQKTKEKKVKSSKQHDSIPHTHGMSMSKGH